MSDYNIEAKFNYLKLIFISGLHESIIVKEDDLHFNLKCDGIIQVHKLNCIFTKCKQRTLGKFLCIFKCWKLLFVNAQFNEIAN